jgi:hypothetical protein
MSGTVPIVLDKARNLRLDVNALADADELAGKAVNEFISGERVGIAAIRALLWAGLKHEDRKLTPTAAGDLMHAELAKGEGGVAPLVSKLREALIASGLFGGPAQKNGKPEAATNQPTSGSGSGQPEK